MGSAQHVRELFNLGGQAAIVTGGATHLWRAMATALGELGAAVYLASRRGELCEQVASALRAEGIDATGLSCDVADEMRGGSYRASDPRARSA